MPEYLFVKRQREIRSLQAERDNLQRRVQELTQTVQSLIEEIRDLNQKKIVWQERDHAFERKSRAGRSFERGNAEFNLP